MENKLEYPFSKAFENGDTIHFQADPATAPDHEYIRNLGYEIEVGGDCSYFARGLEGYDLSGPGGWGSFFPDNADSESKRIFLEMYDKGIVRPIGITKYVRVFLPRTKDWLVFRYEYKEGKGWQENNDKEWRDCNDPYVNNVTLEAAIKKVIG